MTKSIAPPKQLCRRCNGELAYDKKRNCKFCPICYPPNRTQPAPVKEKKKYLDVKMTDERVIELIKEHVGPIIREELENWHIQKPPVTREEIDNSTNNADIPVEPKPETWRQKARRMGVKTHNGYTGGARKKVDVLADMERIENGRVGDTKDQSGS